MSGADGSKRQRIDGFAEDRQMRGLSSQPQMDVTGDASTAGGSFSFDELQRRFSVLLAQVTQVERDVSVAEGSFAADVAPNVPSASLTGAADADNAARRTENRLPTDLYRDHIVGFLPISDAISPARAANTFYGTELINEDFVLRRVDTHLSRHSLTGLIDVQRPTLQYYTKCAHALEQGGAVWCEWADFIRLADIYKLTPSTGLPLIMASQWMAAHLPTKADFHTMPLALRQYSTFRHLLNYRGTSLALTKVDEADDDDGEGKKEAERGDGEEREEGEAETQRYRIGRGEHEWHFETLPLSGLPPRHPYRRTYDSLNPPIRHGDWLLPSFTAFIRRMVLWHWTDQEGVDEKGVFRAIVGRGDERYRSLLTDPIDGHKTDDCICEWEGDDDHSRFIVLKGTEDDTTATYLYLADGFINLYTTEAAIEGHTRLADRYPVAVSLVRALLTEHQLAHIIPHYVPH
ncbi:unnamed protein product [Vitrella brassicaformis CCMP3155]|uniref:Uncharacterized protein n=1 Tax=Vitrella brassicaformis (strain CCMP3155) TaxID=1169540 RepID=A0A0G4FP82_VITBC|nr:unnamed protein product [Vitrella brassicaformis CCMP3155]|eukprot:CEM15813.1 unnamed protein product [Vitrella brassicaformis CCMP3155]